MSKKSKRCILIVAGILLAVLYSFIFSFSEQTGEESGSLSYTISRLGVELWDKLTGGNLTEKVMDELALYFEHPLRKAAHFVEYAVMGVLVYSILFCLVDKKRPRFMLCFLWVFVSAAADELHQYFVPGRWGSMADVLLDTCGGAAGALMCYWFICLLIRRAEKKEKEKLVKG